VWVELPSGTAGSGRAPRAGWAAGAVGTNLRAAAWATLAGAALGAGWAVTGPTEADLRVLSRAWTWREVPPQVVIAPPEQTTNEARATRLGWATTALAIDPPRRWEDGRWAAGTAPPAVALDTQRDPQVWTAAQVDALADGQMAGSTVVVASTAAEGIRLARAIAASRAGAVLAPVGAPVAAAWLGAASAIGAATRHPAIAAAALTLLAFAAAPWGTLLPCLLTGLAASGGALIAGGVRLADRARAAEDAATATLAALRAPEAAAAAASGWEAARALGDAQRAELDALRAARDALDALDLPLAVTAADGRLVHASAALRRALGDQTTPVTTDDLAAATGAALDARPLAGGGAVQLLTLHPPADVQPAARAWDPKSPVTAENHESMSC
jgi:hypothetical protein